MSKPLAAIFIFFFSLSASADVLTEKGFEAFNKIREQSSSCEAKSVAIKGVLLASASYGLFALRDNAAFRNFVVQTLNSPNIGPMERALQIKNYLSANAGYASYPETKIVRALRRAGVWAFAAALVELVYYKYQGADLLTAATITQLFHNFMGTDTMGDGNRSSYYLSSAQAFTEFLRLQSSEDVKLMMNSNPALAVTTVAYAKLLDNLENGCGVIGRVNPSALTAPTSGAQPSRQGP